MDNSILQKITVPCLNISGNINKKRKADIIRGLLLSSKWHLQKFDEEYNFLMYMQDSSFDTNKKYVLISTHIDTVYEMDNCFSQVQDPYFFGTYDNSLTNAVVIDNMLKNKFGNNVIIVFTGNEEYGMSGAHDVCQSLKNVNIEHVIVLDVTYEKYFNKDFTFDNCHHSNYVKKLLIAQTKKICDNFVINPIEDDDETCVYTRFYKCMSLCIPVKGKMHSNKGVLCLQTSLAKYAEVLSLLTEFDFSSNQTSTGIVE